MSKYSIQYIFDNKERHYANRLYLFDDGLVHAVRVVNAHADDPDLSPGVHKWTVHSTKDNAVLYTVIKEVE